MRETTKSLVALIALVLVLGLSIFCFFRCYQGGFDTTSPAILINSGLSCPYAGEQDFLSVTRCCLAHSASWLEQVAFYAMHHDGSFVNSSKSALVYAAGAAVSCFLCFRVGSACIGPLAGLFAALLMCFIPLELWANCSFTAALVLLNFDRLLAALKFHTYLHWFTYLLTTVVMLFNCFFTETVVLQWWFLAQMAFLIMRTKMISSARRSAHFGSEDIMPRLFVKEESGTREVYVFLGISLLCWIVAAIFLVMMSSFSSAGVAYMSTFFKILAGTFLVTAVVDGVILMTPGSEDLRSQFKKYVTRTANRALLVNPDNTFFYTRMEQAGVAMGFCALAILVFSPFVLKIYDLQMRFSLAGALETFAAFVEEGENWYWASLCLPVMSAGLALILRRVKIIHSTEALGIVTVSLFSLLFLLQQRYAAISAPFYVLAAVALPYQLFQLFFFLIRKPGMGGSHA